MRPFFDTVAWLLVCWYATVPAFWLIIHPFTGYWQQWKRSPFRVILPLWLLMIAAAAAVTWPWRRVRLYETPYAWLAAAPLFLLAVLTYHGTRRHISSPQVMGRPEVEPGKHEQKLVTTGMHGRIRHPLYAGHLLMMLGWSAGSGLAVCYALVAFAVATGIVMIHLEEKELERRFGEAYREYKKKVPAVMPLPRRHSAQASDVEHSAS